MIRSSIGYNKLQKEQLSKTTQAKNKHRTELKKIKTQKISSYGMRRAFIL